MPAQATRRPPRSPRRPPRSAVPVIPVAGHGAATQPEPTSRPENSFPIVGLGASAGGLEAFRQFIEALPADTGMAYVLVQHMSPQQGSLLAELLARSSRIPIREIEDGVRVEPNHAYVIPPEKDVVISDGALALVPRTKTRGLHMPIDTFLRTLAEVQKGLAIGIVLSGTGTDGTLGLKAVKGEGGITIAQDPGSAAQDGMPRSAIASGSVDLVLAPDAIARELARLGRHPYVATHQPALRPYPPTGGRRGTDGLAKVLSIIRSTTGADFSAYRRTTVARRVARRMALANIEDMNEYARHLEGNPGEVQALHQDCLISVTSFFRDPAAFQALAERLRPVLRAGASRPVRAWVAGCASGEEAYSIAICLLEAAAGQAEPPALQIFASDISDAALEKARAGIYLESIAQDVSPERLKRFFTRIDGGYQVSKAVRELCVFARHDVIKDPPFSRLDLISCRNLLIYLEPELQQHVLRSFHYALNPHGLLLLGHAETIGALEDQFAVVDKEQRLFLRHAASGSKTFAWASAAKLSKGGREAKASRSRQPSRGPESELPAEADRFLLARYAPAGVIVDAGLKILEFRGETAAYLEHSQGRAGLGLMRMARKGLLHDLRRTVEEARKTGAPARREAVPVREGQKLRKVDIEAVPLAGATANERCLLVTFSDRGPRGHAAEPPASAEEGQGRGRRPPAAELVRENAVLRSELQESAQQLHASVQEHERASEELQAANEEVLSTNEELQSINEELESAKEELQSANEELSTVNQELQERNRQLGSVNDDLLNLLTSVNLPIVIVGRDLRLRRFTPAAEKLLGLIHADVGRPLSELRSSFDTPKLEAEVADTIDSMQAREREVVDREGRFYSLQVRPYWTRESRLDGAVVVLLDIDGLKRAVEDANAIVETAREPLVILDADLRVERANPSFYHAFGVAAPQTEGRLIFEVGDGQWVTPELRRMLHEVLSEEAPLDGYVVEREIPGVGQRTFAFSACRLHYARGGKDRILVAIEDRTDDRRHAAERDLLLARETAARQRAEEAHRLKDEFVATLSHELRGPLSSMVGWVQVLQSGKADPALEERARAAIGRGVQAQALLIEELLDYSRMMKGKVRLAQKPTDLVAAAEAALEASRAAAAAKDISLALERENDRAVVLGDPDRLQQVAWNLISNAVKFTPRGGQVTVRVRVGERHAELGVSDTGRGITASFLPHVFERFRQAEGRASRAEHGLGLGLAIVRSLVELHGGTVTADSPGEGRGATFTASFPIPALLLDGGTAEEEPGTAAAAGSTGAASALTDVDSTLLAGLQILVVEDDVDGQQMLGALFAQSGAQVRYAGSAQEALAAIASAVPDVITCDIALPGEDGYSLMRRLRALPAAQGGAVPALALTAYVGEQASRRAIEAGFGMHLGKPTPPAELVACVAALAGRLAAAPPSRGIAEGMLERPDG